MVGCVLSQLSRGSPFGAVKKAVARGGDTPSPLQSVHHLLIL